MDENIKRTIVLAIVVVVIGKLASSLYDGFMGDTQQDMIANQQALENHAKGVSSESRPLDVASMEQRCAPVLHSDACAAPRDMRQAERCVRRLRSTGCAMLPRVNLCHAVEELELCADPFLDPRETRCDSMRAIADCDAEPIPERWEERDELWTFEVRDAEWAAID